MKKFKLVSTVMALAIVLGTTPVNVKANLEHRKLSHSGDQTRYKHNFLGIDVQTISGAGLNGKVAASSEDLELIVGKTYTVDFELFLRDGSKEGLYFFENFKVNDQNIDGEITWRKSNRLKGSFEFTADNSGTYRIKAEAERKALGHIHYEDVDLTYMPINEYTVTFISKEHNNARRDVKVKQDSTVEKPNIELAGKKLVGWFEEGSDGAFDFENTLINQNYVLYAKWEDVKTPETPGGTKDPDTETPGEDEYTVTFISKEHNNAKRDVKVKPNGTVEEPKIDALAGRRLVGWFEDGSNEAFDFKTPINRNYKLIAKWEDVKTPENPGGTPGGELPGGENPGGTPGGENPGGANPDGANQGESPAPAEPEAPAPVEPAPTPEIGVRPFIEPIPFEPAPVVTETITDDATPLAAAPVEDIEQEDVILEGELDEINDDATPLSDVIMDEEAPLADMPKTEDESRFTGMISMAVALIALGGYAVLSLIKGKKYDK